MKMLRFFSLTMILLAAIGRAQSLDGTLTDSETKEPLVGATVIIQKDGKVINGAYADDEGYFMVSGFPAGTYDIIFTYNSYLNDTAKGVVFAKGQDITLDRQLKINTTEVVTIEETRQTNTEESVIQEIKNEDAVVVGISSEQITKTQDRDASEVMKRVPGVTVVDNRFVMIRGLSERYNTVLLNNGYSPSVETDVKAFSFDLVPSSMLDRMLVYKTPSPDLPGEFAGGVIRLYTKNLPDNDFINVTYAASFRPGTTFKPFSSENADRGFLGWYNGSRDLPSDFPSDISKLPTSDTTRINTLGRSFQTTWAPKVGNAPIDQRFSLSFGKRFDIKKWVFGNTTSINYSNTRRTAEISRNDFTSYYQTRIDTLFSYTDHQYNNNVRFGLLSNFAILYGTNHRIDFNNFFSQINTDQFVFREGRNPVDGNNHRDYAYYYLNRNIFTSQLNGSHTLFQGLSKVTWVVANNRTHRREPDFRRVSTVRDLSITDDTTRYFNNIPFSPQPDQLGRFFSDMTETSLGVGINLEQKIMKDSPFLFKTGFYSENKDRSFTARNIGYVVSRIMTFNPALFTTSLDSLFLQDNINSTTGIKIAEGSKPSDSYTSSNKLFATYFGVETPISGFLPFLDGKYFFDNFKMSGGVRIEHNDQRLNSFKTKTQAVIIRNDILSVLPSLNVSYNFTERMLVRAAYGKTVNRPEFRELAPFAFYDFNYNLIITGFDSLQTPTIGNYDLRWEFYPSLGEMVSVGVFYKDFTNPIEIRNLPNASGGSNTYRYQNAVSAYSRGVEVDIRKSFGFLENIRVVRDLSLVLNASYIDNQVDLGNVIGLENKRQMQGQSKYILNTGLYYTNDSLGLQLSAVYNVVGPRIFLVGNDNYPDIWEMPRHLVDLTFTKQVGKYVSVKGGVQDLLNAPFRYFQDSNKNGKLEDGNGDTFTQRYRIGSYYTLGVTFNLNRQPKL